MSTATDHAGNSTAVAAWTMVSRVTGFVRIAVVAAVLGPTYLGSVFIAVNLLPNLALQFLAGSLIGSMLIPALMPSIDRRDREGTAQLAGGVLGAALVGFTLVAGLAILASPLILGALTLGVADGDVAADQERTGLLLLALTMPQLPLYGVAIVGGAVMNAHGRFRLAAFAPVAENVGLLGTMLAVALLYGTGSDIGSVSDGELLLLGLGSTGAVVLHAGVMLWGARRCVRGLVPRRGWRIEPVRALLRRLRASLGQSGLTALRSFTMLAVANTVPGGVVAFRLAVNFLYLPIQVGAQPITLTVLPTLARLHQSGDAQRFRDECTRVLALVSFLTLPSAVAYVVLARPLADAMAFGAMSGSAGPALVASCLAGVALAVIAESAFQLFTNASYARDDSRSPLVATAAGTAITLACLPVAVALDGSSALLALGLAQSAGAGFSAWYLRRRLDARLPAAGRSARRAVTRTLGASAAMAVPAYAVALGVSHAIDGPVGAALGVLGAAVAGVATFVALQRHWDSAELTFFTGGLRRLRRGTA
jgi:putative peptidoglycan lipid II flippase